MFGVKPNVPFARNLQRDFHIKLNQSIDSFFEILTSELQMPSRDLRPEDGRFDLSYLKSSLSQIHAKLLETNATGLKFGFCNLMEEIAADLPLDELIDKIDNFGSQVKPPTKLASFSVSAYDTLSTLEQDMVDRFVVTKIPEKVSCRKFPDGLFLENFKRLRQAVDALKQADQDIYQEVETLVDQIVFLNIDGFFNSSHFEMLGCVFFGTVAENQTWVRMLEKICHESAHTCLFLLSLEDPLTLNDQAEVYPTVLRRDARPIYGLFHAFFVAAKTLYALSKIKDSLQSNAEKRDYKVVQDLYQRVLVSTWDVLQEKAKFTAVGQEIFQDVLNFYELDKRPFLKHA